MSKTRQKLMISILLLILGFIITTQFQNVKKVTGNDLLLTTRAQQLFREREELAQEKAAMQQELHQLETEIKKFEEAEAEENGLIKNLKDELTKYQILAGSRTLEGAGIIITIKNPETENDNTLSYESTIVYYYYYILGIINKLNIAGAAAIAINDQRYLATTEIVPNVDSLIINGVPITSPISIAAIGDPDELEDSITIPHGLIEEIIIHTNLQVSVKKEANIVIPRTNRVQSFQFAKPIEVSN